MSVTKETGEHKPESALPEDQWRLRATVSVHPATLRELDALCKRFRSNRGRLIDKMVETVSASYKDGRMRCFTGSNCIANRTDLPEVL
jgi:hypothetical protein